MQACIKSFFAFRVMTVRIKQTMMHYSKYKPFKYHPTDSQHAWSEFRCRRRGSARILWTFCIVLGAAKRIIQKHNEKNARGGNLMIKLNILRLKVYARKSTDSLVPLCLAFSFFSIIQKSRNHHLDKIQSGEHLSGYLKNTRIISLSVKMLWDLIGFSLLNIQITWWRVSSRGVINRFHGSDRSFVLWMKVHETKHETIVILSKQHQATIEEMLKFMNENPRCQ